MSTPTSRPYLLDGVNELILDNNWLNLYPNKPSITLPNDGATGLDSSFTIETSPYSGVNNHKSSQYQISTSTDFSSPVYNSGELTNDLVSHTLPNGELNLNTNFYIRARHKDVNNLWSFWSDPIQITTKQQNNAPSKPSITSPNDGATSVDLSGFNIETTNFSGQNNHQSSEYQIFSDSSVSNKVYDSGELTNDLTSHQVPSSAGLDSFSTYYIRARHKDTNDLWSSWSDINQITTKANPPVTPNIIKPNDGATSISVTPQIETSLYSGDGNHQSSEYQISTNTNFSSPVYSSGELTNDLITHTVPNGTLSKNVTYNVRARHKSDTGLWSGWSNLNQFTTETIDAPTVTNVRDMTITAPTVDYVKDLTVNAPTVDSVNDP